MIVGHGRKTPLVRACAEVARLARKLSGLRGSCLACAEHGLARKFGTSAQECLRGSFQLPRKLVFSLQLLDLAFSPMAWPFAFLHFPWVGLISQLSFTAISFASLSHVEHFFLLIIIFSVWRGGCPDSIGKSGWHSCSWRFFGQKRKRTDPCRP